MKIITATITSLALVAGLAIPTSASADERDVARVLGGIAAIAILAEIADRNRDRDRERDRAAAQVTRDRVGAGRLGSRDRWHDDDDNTWGRIIDDRRQRRGPKAGRGYKRQALPQACLRRVETRRGDRLVYGARCLNRNFKHARHLPDDCRLQVRTDRGDRLAYGARCLSRDGWRVARR